MVLAVPLHDLKAGSITFDPSLPNWKSDVHTRLGAATAITAALEFPQPYWADVAGVEQGRGRFGVVSAPLSTTTTTAAAAVAVEGELVAAGAPADSSSPELPVLVVFEDAGQTCGKPTLVARLVGGAGEDGSQLTDAQVQEVVMAALRVGVRRTRSRNIAAEPASLCATLTQFCGGRGPGAKGGCVGRRVWLPEGVDVVFHNAAL